MTNNTFIQKLTDFFKAMGNEKRQEIVLSLFTGGGEHNTGEVAKKVNIAQSTASEHLSMLRRGGILTSRKVEKEVLYRLSREGIMEIIKEIESMLSCDKGE